MIRKITQEMFMMASKLAKKSKRRYLLSKEQPFLVEDEKVSWKKFYKEIFGINVNINNINIPEIKKGFYQLIVLEKGMTPATINDVYVKILGGIDYQGLDAAIKSDRDAYDDSYAVWVRKSRKPDDKWMGLTTEFIKKRNIKGITFEERMILEIYFFWRYKLHLDTSRYITLCTGSIIKNRYFPGFYCFIDLDYDVRINQYEYDEGKDHLGIREVHF